MSSQEFALGTEFELDIKSFFAFDCFLFLKDPSIKPDNLISIIHIIDKYSEINKKSSLDEYLLFFKNNFDTIKKQFNSTRNRLEIQTLSVNVCLNSLRLILLSNSK